MKTISHSSFGQVTAIKHNMMVIHAAMENFSATSTVNYNPNKITNCRPVINPTQHEKFVVLTEVSMP
jgi:delta 1-pyrroline-5-carboxylate dehydrogenase